MKNTYNKFRQIKACSQSTLKFAFALSLLAVMLIQCQTTRIDLPAGFADYEDDYPTFHAVSADAVRIKVYSEANQPKASLEVIKQTMQLHFKSIGYRILEDKSVQSESGLPGHYFITAVQTLNGEYNYLTAVFLDGDDLRVVQAAGQKEAFEKSKLALLSKLKTIQTAYW